MKTEDIDKIYSARARYYPITHGLVMRGRDTAWRRLAAWLCLPLDNGGRVIDVCAGQGHSAEEYMRVWESLRLQKITVTGVEYNRDMIEYGRRRIEKGPYATSVQLVRGDVMEMKSGKAPADFACIDDSVFDAALCVFGAGGIESPDRAFVEMLRVLKTGARAVVIESHLNRTESGKEHAPDRALRKMRIAAMRRLWGWENLPELNELLENTFYMDSTGRRFRLKTISKACFFEPGIILKKAVSVFAGEKCEVIRR